MEENLSGEVISNGDGTLAQQENMLPQSQVNKIVMRESEKAALKARREVEEQYQQKLEAMNTQRQIQQNDNLANTGTRDIDVNALYQQFQERLNADMARQQNEAHINEVARNYLQKMEQGRQSYGSEFDSAMQTFDPAAFPQLIYLVSGMDGAADIMFDLAKNPMKLAAIDRLAEKNPRAAQAELAKLAGSIASNREAQQEASTQGTAQPLDHLTPTRNAGSNGKPSISDLRSQSWLRG